MDFIVSLQILQMIETINMHLRIINCECLRRYIVWTGPRVTINLSIYTTNMLIRKICMLREN